MKLRMQLILRKLMMFFMQHPLTTKEITMWTKPEATEMRFGFEVTMYVCNR
ncbi:pyrroloquinoline quinone precursor peptide PqqA [Methylovorus mays]|nr:pyrroloquinoline quinone precursor peptide PqqA [Methylovorus mays]